MPSDVLKMLELQKLSAGREANAHSDGWEYNACQSRTLLLRATEHYANTGMMGDVITRAVEDNPSDQQSIVAEERPVGTPVQYLLRMDAMKSGGA